MGTVGLALLLAAGRVCTAADHVAPVDLLKHAGSGATTIERDGPQQVRWHLADGQRQVLKVDLAAQGIDPSAYDELRFDIMPEGSQVSLQTALQGFPGERDVTSWYLKFKTTVGRWTPGRYDLRLDDDGIFLSGARTEDPAGTLVLTLGRRVLGTPGEVTWRTARIRNARLVRRLVTVDFDMASARIIDDAGEIGCIYELALANRTDTTQTVTITPDSRHALRHFQIDLPRELTLNAGETRRLPVRVSMARSQAMRLPPLYAEPLVPEVRIHGVPDSDVVPLMGYRAWPMWGVVPPFNRRAATPAETMARLAAREKVLPTIDAWRQRVLRAAETAAERRWPIPSHVLPGHTLFYRCQTCRIYPQPVDPARFHRHKCPKCGTLFENNAALDAAYVGRYYGTLATHVRNCGLAWLLTGDDAHAATAVRILRDLADAHAEMPVAGRRSTSGGTALGCSSLLTSYVLPLFAEGYAYVTASPVLDEPARLSIRRFLTDEACRTARHSTEYSNMTAEHFRAYGSVGLATGFWPLAAEAIHGEFGWHELVEYAFSEDGIGHEAGAYHRSIFKAMNDFGMFAAERGVDLYTARFKRVFDGSLSIGETAVSFEVAYRAYRDPAYLRVLAMQRARPNEASARWGVLGLPDLQAMPVASEVLPGTGYVFLRQGHAADFAGLHLNYIKPFDRGEYDRLTTFFFHNRQQVDGTAGRIIYSSPRSHWMYATAAHNTIVIDGSDQRNVNAQLVAFAPADPTPAALVATDPAAPLYDGVQQLRGIALIEGCYVVFDVVRADRPCTIDRYQHGRGKLNLHVKTAVPGSPVAHLPAHGAFSAIETAPCGGELRIDFGNHLRMRLVSDHDLAAYKAVTVGGWQAEPREVTFARAADARQAAFLAAFSFGKDIEPPQLHIERAEPDDTLLRVTVGANRYAIHAGYTDRRLEIARENPPQ